MAKVGILLCLTAVISVQSGELLAQSQDPPDVESRFDLNTFNRSASTPDDGFELDGAGVLKSLQFSAVTLFQVDDDPLTWQRETGDGDYEETAVVVERLLVLHLGAAIGLFDIAQVALHFPIIFDRGTTNSRGGVGDLSIIPKVAYRFKPTGRVGLAFLVPVTFPTGDANRLLGEGSLTATPVIAMDTKWDKLQLVFNAGYRLREKQRRDLVRGSELRFGAGVSYDVLTSPGLLRAIVEADAATQVGDLFARAATPVTLMGGVKHRFKRGFGYVAAAGAGVTPGVGAPDFRLVFGVDYVFTRMAQAEESEPSENVDTDGDGIPKDEDKCPTLLEDFDGFEDLDGCPETDNDADGIPDDRDNCPNVAETINGLYDDDGCPDSDSDGDGLLEEEDQCPTEPEDLDGFGDEDGCPDLDNDYDDIEDQADTCPNYPETFNDYRDEDGCPDYLEIIGDKIVLTRPMRFQAKTSELKESSYPVLDELALVIIANPAWTEIDIVAHTSGRGRASDQLSLSEERAQTLKRLLIHSGVLAERLTATGKGGTEPIASPTTIEGRKENARVELIIRKGAR
ncbi:MAG: transporter [Myxococcota bacterium]|nr:transporter [Myxococcota bacterium]